MVVEALAEAQNADARTDRPAPTTRAGLSAWHVHFRLTRRA